MTAHDLLSELRAKGVDVKTSGGARLVIDAPRGTVNEEMRAALSANKAALIEILNDEASSSQPVIEPPQYLSEFEPPTPPPAPPVVEATQPVAPEAPVMPPPAPPVVKSEIVDSTAEEIAQLQ